MLETCLTSIPATGKAEIIFANSATCALIVPSWEILARALLPQETSTNHAQWWRRDKRLELSQGDLCCLEPHSEPSQNFSLMQLNLPQSGCSLFSPKMGFDHGNTNKGPKRACIKQTEMRDLAVNKCQFSLKPKMLGWKWRGQAD